MAPDSPLFCWSCQCGLTLDLYVHLGENRVVPCCTECWEKMPIEQRLRVAQMFADRYDGGVIDATTALFRSAFGQFIAERGGDQWLRGQGN